MRATRFYIKMFYLLPTEYIYVFCEVLKNRVIITSYSFELILNNAQQDPNILAYLFIPNQLYIFRVMSSSIIRST